MDKHRPIQDYTLLCMHVYVRAHTHTHLKWVGPKLDSPHYTPTPHHNKQQRQTDRRVQQ